MAAARRDASIFLICGDLGYSVLEPFATEFPDRFLNAGVAEQNMTGVATGLASCGYTVFTYSIANFPVFRCLEQIRNDICYHDLNVKIVSVGGGVAYGPAGYSHHATEDLAVMRHLPGMTVAAPGDPHETRAVVDALVCHPGPAYLRLGKAGEPNIHAQPISLQVGESVELRSGSDLTLICTGGMLETAFWVSYQLGKQGVSAQVISMPFVSPIDGAAIERVGFFGKPIITLEEHGSEGLGSAVAKLLLAARFTGQFKSLKLAAKFIATAENQKRLRQMLGLDPGEILGTAKLMCAA